VLPCPLLHYFGAAWQTALAITTVWLKQPNRWCLNLFISEWQPCSLAGACLAVGW
jgi:hypothetical protein